MRKLPARATFYSPPSSVSLLILRFSSPSRTLDVTPPEKVAGWGGVGAR